MKENEGFSLIFNSNMEHCTSYRSGLWGIRNFDVVVPKWIQNIKCLIIYNLIDWNKCGGYYYFLFLAHIHNLIMFGYFFGEQRLMIGYVWCTCSNTIYIEYGSK